MTAKLNDELQRALKEDGEGPLEVVDPETSKVYVFIARDQFDRLKPLFEPEPMTHEEQRELLRQAGKRAGWDDSEMDVYDRLVSSRGCCSPQPCSARTS